jgi:hypothetical protein
MAGKAGRPVSTKDYFRILLRLPPDLQRQVEQCHALLQRQHGPKFTQTQALWRILQVGCAALTSSETAAPGRAPTGKRAPASPPPHRG